MVLLCYETQVEARFLPFGVVLILTQVRCSVCAKMYHRLRNHFGHTGWNSKMTWVMANLVPVRLVSVQDRCIVCTKCTIGLEIVLDQADGTAR
jgi:hypothetical protein